MSLKKYQNRSYMYLIAKLVAAILNLFSISLFTHYLSANQYGNYLLFTSYVSLICSLFFWWHRLAVYRYFHKYKDNYSSYIKTSYFLYWSLNIILLLLCFIIMLLQIDEGIKYLIYICIIGAIIKSNFDLNQTLLNIKRDDIVFGVSIIIRSVLFISIGLILIQYYEVNASVLIYAFMISFFCVSIFSYVFVLQNYSKGEFNWNIANKYFSYGLPLLVLFIFDYILSFSDRLYLSYYLGSEMVGIYGSNYDLVKQILLFLMIIQSYIIYPKLNHAYEENKQHSVGAILSFNLNIYMVVFIPICVIVIYFNQLISDVFIGDEFTIWSPKLIPLFATMFLLWGTKIYHFDYFFQLKEKMKYPMYILCVGSIVNIFFNIIFIPKLGIIGAAYATSIAYVMVFIISMVSARRLIPNTIDFIILIKTSSIIIISLFIINIPFISKLNDYSQIIIFLLAYSLITMKFNFKKIKQSLHYLS